MGCYTYEKCDMRKKVTAIATRLNYFMALHAINGANLARGTKIQPSTINKILNNKITDPRISTIQALSSFFGVTTEEFLKESTKMEVQTELLYPLIDFASRWPVLENMVAPRFKVEYYGEDMAPFFTNGSVLEFDKTIQAKNKDFVLALINSGLEKPVVVFRR